MSSDLPTAIQESNPEKPGWGGVDGFWVLAGLAVPLAGLLLTVVDGERIAFRLFPELPLPHVCWSRMLFAGGCPFCGLTRSAVYLCQGELAASLEAHRFGWLAVGVLVAQVPCRFVRLQRRGEESGRSGWRWEGWMWGGLGVLLVGNWLWEMAGIVG